MAQNKRKIIIWWDENTHRVRNFRVTKGKVNHVDGKVKIIPLQLGPVCEFPDTIHSMNDSKMEWRVLR